MTPSEQARKNHDELFPSHVSTLTLTNPELIETFDNFAFDEVLRHDDLVFDFIHLTNEVLAERGIELPLPGQSTTTPENGLAVRKEIIGEDVAEKLCATAAAAKLHIPHYLSANCFGDNYALRPRRADARASHLQHACRTRRLRTTGRGPRRRQPQGRQRPTTSHRWVDPASAVHRRPAHAQCAAGRREGHCVVNGRALRASTARKIK